MKTFFDSSAFAKRYIEEKGSEAVERLCGEATELALSVICIPEIISAFNRRVREGNLSPGQYREVKARLAADVIDADIINLVPEVVADAIGLMEGNALRAMDALHVACAIQWNADLFVSSDERQLSAARREKIRTRKV